MVPDEITLAEVRDHMRLSREMTLLGAIGSTRNLGIRFVRKPEETGLPDTMTIGEFRALAAIGRASIIIDDGTGGVTVGKPELVD